MYGTHHTSSIDVVFSLLSLLSIGSIDSSIESSELFLFLTLWVACIYLGRQHFFQLAVNIFSVCIMKIKVRAFIENAISIDTIHRSNFLIMNWPEWGTVNSLFIIHYRHVRTCVCAIIQFVLQFRRHCYACESFSISFSLSFFAKSFLSVLILFISN